MMLSRNTDSEHDVFQLWDSELYNRQQAYLSDEITRFADAANDLIINYFLVVILDYGWISQNLQRETT